MDSTSTTVALHVPPNPPEFVKSEIRKELATLVTKNYIFTPPPYHGALFFMNEYAAIHSEPDINEDRIYVGIVPGTKEQIKKLSLT